MRVINTSSFKETEALEQLIRASALYVLVLQMEEDNLIDQCLTEILKSVSNSKPVLTRNGFGIPADVCNSFVRQLKLWLEGKIDWDVRAQETRFQSAITTFFLYLQEVIFDTEEADLNKAQLEIRQQFDPDELTFIKAILGYTLNLGRSYQSVRTIDFIIKATKELFPDVKTLIYQQTAEDTPDYDAPADYESKVTTLKAILERNQVASIADPIFGNMLATYAGLEKLKRENEGDYKQYVEIHKYLNAEAFKAIISDIVNDCDGMGNPWNAVYKRVTQYSEVYIPTSHYPNGSWTGIIEVIKTERGDYGILYRSPYGEPLKQQPVGNIEMNSKYEKGSSQFIARYVVPNSRGLTKNYIYTLEATKTKNLDRFSETRNILDKVDEYRGKWMKDVKSLATALDSYQTKMDKAKTPKQQLTIKGPTALQWRKGILAMICEIGYQAAPRTGERGTSSIDKGSNSRVPTYALTTLTMRHLVVDPVEYNPVNWAETGTAMSHAESNKIKSVSFNYRGKAAEPQYHTFTDVTTDGDTNSRRILMRILRSYIGQTATGYATVQEDRNDIGRQNIFKIPAARGATLEPITDWIVVVNKHVNGYLKSLGFPATFTFKMFRKLKATKEFMDYMDSVKSQLTPENIDNHVMQGASESGRALGHAAIKRKATGTMAMQYYIVSAIVLEYYQAINATPGKRIANLIKDNINDSKS